MARPPKAGDTWLEKSDVIINLAGESIGGGRWTTERKARIRTSRQEAGQALVSAVQRAVKKPAAAHPGFRDWRVRSQRRSGVGRDSAPRGIDYLIWGNLRLGSFDPTGRSGWVCAARDHSHRPGDGGAWWLYGAPAAAVPPVRRRSIRQRQAVVVLDSHTGLRWGSVVLDGACRAFGRV